MPFERGDKLAVRDIPHLDGGVIASASQGFAIGGKRHAAEKGGILLSVHSDDSEWAKRAKAVLTQTGAEDISSTGETKGDVQNTDRPMPRVGVS